MSGEQLALDIEGMLHEARVQSTPEWSGAPMHFTTDYYSPGDLDAAFEHWQFLHAHDPVHSGSRLWSRSIAVPESGQAGGHGAVLYTADLRCEPWKHADKHQGCMCVGDLIYQAICEPCEWHAIADRENSAVEMWHDHALPGWRELPVVPSRLRMLDKDGLSKATRKWIEEHYPRSMQIPGAPIISERRPFGTRHVPGRSPWGGYDLSHTAVDPERIVEGSKPLRRPTDHFPAPPRSAAQAPAVGLGD